MCDQKEEVKMQAVVVNTKQYGRDPMVEPDGVTAQFSNWLARIFGCWHSELSRPFTHEGGSYRACLECGARRDFDPVKWEMVGSFYYDRPQTRDRATPLRAAKVVHRRRELRLVAGVR